MAGTLPAVRRAAEVAAGHATTFGYVSGWRLVRLLPEPAARALFDRIADEVYRRNGRGVRRLRGNLARIGVDDLDRVTHEAMRSYMRYWCESFRLPSRPLEEVLRRTRTVGEHHLRDAHAAGHGAVVALPHMANWDQAGAWACGTGMPLATVAERLRPERLYDEFVTYRNTLGMEILPTGDPKVFERLVDWAEAGGLVCLLADRDLSRAGVEVTLCGHRARMPRGPAVLARRTGAPLVPTTLHYDGPDLVLTFHPPVPAAPGEEGVVAMMQEVADRFTEGLRSHPQDWHMLQRVFVDDSGGV